VQTIGELMTRDPETIEPECSAVAALELMIDRGIRHLPVLDRRGRLRGIVSLDDLRAALPISVSLSRALSRRDRDSAEGYTVAEVMTHGPITADPKTTLSHAAARLARFRVGCLPVVEADGRLVGIFSETDALRALAQTPEASPGAAEGRSLDLELLAAELRAEHGRIRRQLEHIEQAERELQHPPDSDPSEIEERAQRLTELEVEKPLEVLVQHRLEALERALERVERGGFGRCEQCKREIPIARLRALPDAARCMRCASAQ
jgi:acetoin utilization protein AcuB